MVTDTLESKAHELVGQLDPAQLAAVVRLLEVMLREEELSEEDRQAVSCSREYFRQGGEGTSFDQVLGEGGFTIDQIRGAVRD